MSRSLALLLVAATLGTPPHAQIPAPAAPPFVLHTSAQLVVVDVVAEDKNGHPIHGLKPEDFRVTEGNAPQTIRHVDEHSSLTPTPSGPQLPPLPPSIYTDYTPIAPNSTLNILLLDALNTPLKDQSFVRHQLQQYVNQTSPGTRIAIFGLANRLILLQDFTSDPATLRNVVEHKLIPRSSSLLEQPSGTSSAEQQLSTLAIGPSATDLAANLRQFESEMGSMETELRAQFTLDAFNTLGHYLAAFPGRKNLIWFSGSFPTDILPDPDLANPLEIVHSDDEEFRETVNLLSNAQVSVYPIDARGLMLQPVYDSSSPVPAYANHAAHFSADLKKFDQSEAAEHATMNKLASETGGHAIYNTNNLAKAVAQAIDAGSNYYTLSYTPTNPNQDGSFRQIHIALSSPEANPGTQLAYPRGYYAAKAAPQPDTTATTQTATADNGRARAYGNAAMSRGAPAPQDLLFKVRVLPASNTTETAAAANNKLDPGVSDKGPFRRYHVDYLALPGELTFTLQPNGNRSAKVEFLAYVFDADGRLLNFTGRTISFEATPSNFAELQHSALQCHLEISVPDRVETFLRIGVHDVTSNKFGVVELPTSDVSRLPPPAYNAPPVANPVTPTPPSPTPPSATGHPTPPQV